MGHAILEIPSMDTIPTPSSDPQKEIRNILAEDTFSVRDTSHLHTEEKGLSLRSKKIIIVIIVFIAIVVLLVIILNQRAKNVGLSPEQKSAIIKEIKKRSAYDVVPETQRQALSEEFKTANQNAISLTDEQKQSIRNNTNAQ